MKNVSKYALIFLVLLLASCKEEVEKPKVIYENRSKPKVDTTQIEIADLPVQMPGTNYLIHPVGDLNVYDGRSKPAASVDRISFTISNTSEFEITGYLRNLKFQEMGSDTIKALTDKPVLIQTATYLKTVSDKTKQQIMVYTLADTDTNKDGKLDTSDIKTLYISEISGKRFMKISPELQDLIDWNLIESKNHLYFRTIEDANKNGQFDKNDILYYHFVDLTDKDWKVLDYKPI